MPCPLFEPQKKTELAQSPLGRFPLLFEFEGACGSTTPKGGDQQHLQICNLGYAKGRCSRFPDDFPVSAVRFHVTAKTAQVLSVLVLEEADHWPYFSYPIKFLIAEGRLDPEIEDRCRRAQIFQFCRSFLEKF